jgi:hypothetical protein
LAAVTVTAIVKPRLKATTEGFSRRGGWLALHERIPGIRPQNTAGAADPAERHTRRQYTVNGNTIVLTGSYEAA